MKIAIVSNTSWSIYNFRRNLIKALQEEGHEVMTIGSYDKFLHRLNALGIRAVAIPFVRTRMNPPYEIRAVYLLRRVLKNNQIEVVLSFTPKGNIYSALAAKGLGIRQLANISGLGSAFIKINTLSLWILRLYWFAFRNIDHVFFQNEVDREIFLARGIVEHLKTSRLPGSGVDLSCFVPGPFRQAQADAPHFLLLGRLLWDKGVGEYVEAARIIKAEFPKAQFFLLGGVEAQESEGPSRSQIEAWSREGVVGYLGRVDDVRRHILAADCVVLPTAYREGVPRSLLEAAAMGRPLIASDSIGSRETLIHQQTGFLCKPRDAQDLAAKMRRFIALDQNAREEMGRKGRGLMEREFDEQVVIRRYLKIIQQLAPNPPA